MRAEIRLEDLVGRRVVDANGELVGRIADVAAEWEDNRLVVTEILIGKASTLARLESAVNGTDEPTLRVAWSALDLSDPLSPRLNVTAAALPRSA